jgi:putative DNA primase/helicase
MLAPDQKRIEEIFGRLQAKDKNGNGGRTNGRHRASAGDGPGTTKLDDKALLGKLYGEPEGEKWRDVYGGDFEAYYASASEAVAAVLRKLTYYSGNDPVQIERLIRNSGLASEKFDEPRGGSTWLQKEIASAIEDTPQNYSPKHGKKGKGGEAGSPTHDEIRDRWLLENPDIAFGLEEWRGYEGGTWKAVKPLQVRRSMVRTLEGAKAEGIRPSRSLLDSVQELIRLEVYVEDERWDADPDILLADNGVVDVLTGELLPHEPGHYATAKLPFAYDPNASAPRWEHFLRNTLEEEITRFLQEYAGYCFTTDTLLEKALWLAGPPGGGKSTFLEGLTATLGVRAGVLGLAEIQKSRFALAKLEGKTLVTATEQPGGFLTCHSILNAIISGEPIQVERKFKDPYDLIPRAKIAWAMNEVPRVPSGAEGLFRRVEVVPFPGIAEKDRDPTLKEDIRGEGAGIFNWALEGLQRLRGRGGFEVPSVIQDASAQFRKNNDIPALFVEERCLKGEDRKVQSLVLYRAYKDWCSVTGHKAQSTTTIAEDWKRLGFTKCKANGLTYWRGVELDVDTDDLFG